MGEKIRRKESFQPTFIQVPAQVESNIKSGSTLSFDIEPLPAVGNCAHVDNCNKRLIPHRKLEKNNY